MRPTISVVKTSNSKNLQTRLSQLSKKAVYVGIPSTTSAARRAQLTKLAGSTGDLKKKEKLTEAASSDINNAELLYIFSKGSPANRQPPRPVIEPAIVAPGNKEAIAHELAQATKAGLEGKPTEVDKFLKRAGIAGQNASKSWFTDSRNGWAPNAQRTIDEKGSDRPGIDTGAMRDAITYVVKDEEPSK